VTETEHTLSFVLDASPPTVSIARPADLSWVTSNVVHFAWTASDSGSGLATAQIRLDGGPWLEPMTVASHDFVGLADGKHILSVRITDAVGLYSDASVRITVDTAGPVITVLAPTQGQVAYLGDVPLVWNVTDRDSKVVRVEIFFDGGSTAYDVTNRTSMPWKAPPVGTHAFVLRATDSNGWVTQVGQSFTVQPAAPPPVTSVLDVAVITALAMGVGVFVPRLFGPAKAPPSKRPMGETRDASATSPASEDE
jgi:hypothetical protein